MVFKNRPPKILIVEDDYTNHPLFLEAYKNAGFEVLIVDNADGDFIQTVTNFKPDVISIDLMIGKFGQPADRDGFEAIELLKSDDRTFKIPVVVVSSFFQKERVMRAKELGVRDYINLQNQSISKIAELFKSLVKNPRRYKSTHPLL